MLFSSMAHTSHLPKAVFCRPKCLRGPCSHRAAVVPVYVINHQSGDYKKIILNNEHNSNLLFPSIDKPSTPKIHQKHWQTILKKLAVSKTSRTRTGIGGSELSETRSKALGKAFRNPDCVPSSVHESNAISVRAQHSKSTTSIRGTQRVDHNKNSE